jgi:hypothetical protein
VPLPALATTQDAADYGYTLPPDTASALLTRASTRVRRAAGQPITQSTSTVRLNPDRNTLVLPAPPITAVTAVSQVNLDGTLTALTEGTDWIWDGDAITFASLTVARAEVTYTHGYATVPDGLVELVCQIANRLSATPDGTEGLLRQRSIDDYSETFATEAIAAAGDLLPSESAVIDSIFGDPDVKMVSSR